MKYTTKTFIHLTGFLLLGLSFSMEIPPISADSKAATIVRLVTLFNANPHQYAATPQAALRTFINSRDSRDERLNLLQAIEDSHAGYLLTWHNKPWAIYNQIDIKRR